MKRMVTIACGLALAGCGLLGSRGPAPVGAADLIDARGEKVGTATFREQAGGTIEVIVDAAGLAPGAHGIHIHAVGTCDPPDFTSAGAHFDPTKRKHGLQNPEGAHGGDLPNLVVDQAGRAHYDVATDRITLRDGPRSVFQKSGTALVVHEHEDDQKTDPTGDSGARIACGVIRRR